mmetsp:Transcript_31140/g.96376  ORF Transcript_31140/g.96376 Transcript_31140/m.96376 type:complete len:249 (-) Transcript_31140:23-769(-)
MQALLLVVHLSSALSATFQGRPASAPGLAPPQTPEAARERLWAALQATDATTRRAAVAAGVDGLLGSEGRDYETRAFVEWSLGGCWALDDVVTNRASRNPDALAELSRERDVELVSATQTLDFAASSATHEFRWRRPVQGDAGTIRATCDMDIAPSTTRLRSWTVTFGDVTHALVPDGKLRSAAVDVVDAVARLAPLELFDAAGVSVVLEYVDPELRLMGVAPDSSRGANSVHVFSRRGGPWGLSGEA